MRAIVVDDECLAMQSLCEKLEGIDRVQTVHGFGNPREAIEYVKKNEIDVAFLDIEMFDMNGIELAKAIKEIRPPAGIIFVSGHFSYAMEAFGVHANGYLLKPVSEEQVKEELDVLSKNRGIVKYQEDKLWVSAFGSFQVTCGGSPIKFQRSKTKELLAYLIDRRGAAVTMGELIGVLWEDKTEDGSSKSQLRTLISDLTNALKQVGLGDVIIKHRNSIAVDVRRLDCDYYRFLEGDVSAINSYMGEYMSNYSWAEFTAAKLQEKERAGYF